MNMLLYIFENRIIVMFAYNDLCSLMHKYWKKIDLVILPDAAERYFSTPLFEE